MGKSFYPQTPILLVDDEDAWLHSFGLTLRSAGLSNIETCNDPREVVTRVSQTSYSVIVLDLTMPHLAGDELLPLLTTKHPEIPVIIITGLDTVDTAVHCMKLGAYDFYTKVAEDERLITGVRRAVEVANLRRENAALKIHFFSDNLQQPEAFTGLITHNQAMHSIFQYMEAIATTSEPVLITGETGVGKELIAKAVHHLSQRSGEFVAVNISGYEETLLADTLFGHRKGAYSGAENARKGLVAKADGGSLFLDEIGDLSSTAQVKLLRLIQEREYYPLGSDMPRSTSARMLFATHQNLDTLQDSGKFRQDLFFRLRTHHIHIPPLRDRLDDLPLLLEHFLEIGSEKLGKSKPAYPKELPILLGTYDYPGNIRELESMIFNALSKHQSHTLSMDDFKEYISNRTTARSESALLQQEGETLFSSLQPLPSLKEAGRQLIREALIRAQGNQTIAAQMLGMTRQALNWRVKQDEALEKKVA